MKRLYFFLLLSLVYSISFAQSKLYDNTFSLSDVKLLDGPFKRACDLNINVLLQYDTDRLLAPLIKEAGLPEKAMYFPNWAGLDGHVAGHYLSALAIHYAATGNKQCKERMDYIVSEMRRCQQANGDGYIGGVPDGHKIWSEIKNGNPRFVFNYWVPWYNVHKTFAGLRDAWIYGDNSDAEDMFFKLCDWGISVINPLSDQQMKSMVAQEYGGMNEVYADAYKLSGKHQYLEAAKRFGSDYLYEEMSIREDKLDNRHANTQVPKAVGYYRTGELSGDESQLTAGDFFWETVTKNRSLSFGGNSRREYFPSKNDCFSYVEDREGPESCNTYNMLKLTKSLFRVNPEPKYSDYYERAMFNHILSTQHPEHGGYVYFTSVRPAHYRVYSSPNNGMWCCVGTGMENHGKYGEFIYTHVGDSLYVNLFVASELNWKEKGVKIIQQTNFPEEGIGKITVRTQVDKAFPILIRYPWWVKPGEMEVVCNGHNYALNGTPSSYITINRKWNDGDVIELKMPMHFHIEELPNESDFISILRGPIVMGVRMGDHDLRGLVADDHRWAHIAHGSLVSLFDTPAIIGTREEIRDKLEKMKPISDHPGCFVVPELFSDNRYKDLILEPFNQIHDSRYIVYWLSTSQEKYDLILEKRRIDEETKLILDKRTIDAVNIGEQQPEVDHQMKQRNSHTGSYWNEQYREAHDGGFIQYELDTRGEQKNVSLMLRYWGKEEDSRIFDILIDNELLTTEDVSGKWNKDEFINVEYVIPEEKLSSKNKITILFKPKDKNTTARLFYMRLLSNK